jgi:hypothetical protein
MYASGRRSLPAKSPTGFIRRSWRRFVMPGGVVERKAYEISVCLSFSLRPMEVMERLVRVLYRAEWSLDFALGACRRAPAIGPGGHVRHDLHAQAFHHALEHGRFRDRPLSS